MNRIWESKKMQKMSQNLRFWIWKFLEICWNSYLPYQNELTLMKGAIVFSVRTKLKTLAINVPILWPNETPPLKIKFWIMPCFALLFIVTKYFTVVVIYIIVMCGFHFDAYQHSSSVTLFMKEFCKLAVSQDCQW